jgi:hypothetical protein
MLHFRVEDEGSPMLIIFLGMEEEDKSFLS